MKAFDYLKKLNSADIRLKGRTFAEGYFLIFFVGSVIGWIYEFISYLAVSHIILNSGVLYGPYLPIYGFGALLIILLGKPFRKYPPFVFIVTGLATGLLEYGTGYVMYLVWQKRWWDYTGCFLNINGFVCLESVLTFAVGGLLLIYFIEPFMLSIIAKAPPKRLNIISAVIAAIMLTDVIITLLFREQSSTLYFGT